MDSASNSGAQTSTSLPTPLELLLSRRSTRRFLKDPIPEQTIEQLLRAAMAAPSAGNEQPWRFIVVDDPETMIATASDRGMRMLAEAPLAILVCGEPRAAKYRGFWFQDCAAATENLLLAAHFLGWGAAWMGLYPIGYRIRKVRKVIGLPRRIVPFAFVAIGQRAEEKTPNDHFEADRVHRNRWDGVKDRKIAISVRKALELFGKRHVRTWLRR